MRLFKGASGGWVENIKGSRSPPDTQITFWGPPPTKSFSAAREVLGSPSSSSSCEHKNRWCDFFLAAAGSVMEFFPDHLHGCPFLWPFLTQLEPGAHTHFKQTQGLPVVALCRLTSFIISHDCSVFPSLSYQWLHHMLSLQDALPAIDANNGFQKSEK